MKYLSLFTGIGGFELGIQQAHESNIKHAHIGAKSKQKERTPRRKRAVDKHEVLIHTGNRAAPLCVGYSEIDKYAIQIYQAHFPEHKNYGDITKINEKELPDFDLLCGGFPCQAFSIAGQRRGFEDTRGTLFFEIARILKTKKPRLLLLENVKGLLSHDNGRTFKTIIATLDDLGYDLQWQVLNSKNHGVPQNRERVLIVGHLRGTPRPKVFPITRSDSDTDAGNKKGKERIADTVTARYASRNGRGTHIEQLNQPRHSNDRVYSVQGLAPTLNTMQGGMRQPFIAMTETRTEKSKKIRRVHMKAGRDWSPRRGKKLIPRKDEISNTITAGQSKEHFLTDGMSIRRLTPIECERLQGFPDNWTGGVSDTQRYKTLGNAVTVNVIRDVCNLLLSPTPPLLERAK